VVEISQKIAQKLLQKSQKLLFVKKLLKNCPPKQQQKNCCSLALFGLMQKYANCTIKVRFLSIFAQFCGVTSVAK